MTDDLRRWRPTTQAEVHAAIAENVLNETHYLDVKREVGSGQGERSNIAKALASFALDGGSLLIGLEEDKQNRTWSPKPQPLDGLPERVEQIATHLIDPPLYTVATEIPTGEAGHGYLLVEVPPSPLAPHMVGGIYYGRGDRTRVRLSDAEVLRYHARRQSLEQIADRLLDAEAARDPQPDSRRRQVGRMYAVAQPLTAPGHLARGLIGDQQALRDIITAAERQIPRETQAEPAPHRLNYHSRRAQGVALSDYSLTGPGRTLVPHREDAEPTERSMLDLEVRQDGGLRLLVGRLSDEWGRDVRTGEDVTAILDALAVGYSLRLVRWAAAIAGHTGYRGQWALGVHGTHLRGHISSVHIQRGWGGSEGYPYDAEDYRETTTATYQEMTDRPQAVAERLVGRLARALGTDVHWQAALSADA